MVVKKVKLFLMMFLVLNLIISCKNQENQENQTEIKDSYLDVKGINYLKYGGQNYIHYRYFNPEFEKYTINENRFLKMYYVFDNEVYKGEIEDISDFHYKAIENIGLKDSIYIETFGLKGKKTVTFIMLDLIEIPVGTDSVKLEYTEERYFFKTDIE